MAYMIKGCSIWTGI